MTTEQPDALALADYLKDRNRLDITCDEAAAKLQELHTENQQLVELSLEQAKIVGNSAERELRLMAELDKVKRITLRDEALLRQALEALESIDVDYRSASGWALEVSFDEEMCDAAAAALKERLNEHP